MKNICQLSHGWGSELWCWWVHSWGSAPFRKKWWAWHSSHWAHRGKIYKIADVWKGKSYGMSGQTCALLRFTVYIFTAVRISALHKKTLALPYHSWQPDVMLYNKVLCNAIWLVFTELKNFRQDSLTLYCRMLQIKRARNSPHCLMRRPSSSHWCLERICLAGNLIPLAVQPSSFQELQQVNLSLTCRINESVHD